MGNSASSSGRGHHDETVDYGHLSPQGVYTGSKDWNHAIVTQLIADRKLAPFYRPLEDYDDAWDDDRILAARRDPPESEPTHPDAQPPPRPGADSRDTTKSSHNPSKRPSNLKEPSRCPEAAVYRGAVECPICFLYYPPNINRSRCCDQSICTECFVQIKRNEPTATHLVSDPAACPYCVQDNFGVTYTPPPWRAGIGSEGTVRFTQPFIESSTVSTQKRRRKSFGHDSPEVVTTDQIRPDWEAKLAAVRSTVARRANRRIIMRQVGDRLIPVGVTSGRVHALPSSEDGHEPTDNGGSRRSRRQRHQNPDINQLLGSMGLGGQDLEELMVMEAMRLSLLEHEEQQRREADKRKNEGEEVTEGVQSRNESTSAAQPSSQSSTPTNVSSISSHPTSNPASELSSTSENNASGSSNIADGSTGSQNAAQRSRSATPSSEHVSTPSNHVAVDTPPSVSMPSTTAGDEQVHLSRPPISGSGNGRVESSMSTDSATCTFGSGHY
ncbi:hypothetical protein SERLA73DRAFT_60498 [Serpula lacrymans var. lacrymans S7.3]|uniref:RING-type domain-containing protein n=1 Tax=Serpula lacrymans var. lacrymans (strain S7.3) TaxID=936435 RepID=F8Q7E0_SERL3|nr:hypothetical protein SERLA73DRAFT_60498 [Serpula lacrymans var. lacrymans S7.3]